MPDHPKPESRPAAAAAAPLPAPDALLALDALTLSARIRRREVSCEALMQATLARIDQVNPVVNAIVARQPADQLLAQARTADKELDEGHYRGWLHGLPQAPKDLALTRGIVTTKGSPIFRDHLPHEDSLVVARARQEGAILIGKTNVPEFGLGSQSYNPVYGVTRNAWQPALCAGGSSGGAAVALATHMLAVADGSDMMGSLRNPAAFNHVYGFRPSAGRVPMVPGVDQFVQQLGVEGPMGRTPQDCARLLATQAGEDPRAPLSLSGDGSEFIALIEHWQQQAGDDRPLRGRRIGWLADMDGHLAMEDGLLEQCTRALKVMETLGARIEPVSLKYPAEKLWTTWLTLRQCLQGGNLSVFYDNPAHRALLKPEVCWEVENARGASTIDFFQASVNRTQFYLAMLQHFAETDFLMLPSAQVYPFAAELHWPREIAGRTMDTYHRWMEAVLPATMAGLPAMNLPVPGTDDEKRQGKIAGVQLIGPPKADAAVLQASFAYHAATRAD